MTDEQRKLAKIREYVIGTMSIDYDFMDHDYELDITVGDVANYLIYEAKGNTFAALQTFKEEKLVSRIIYDFIDLFQPLLKEDEFYDFIKEWYEENARDSWDAEREEMFERD